MHNHTLNYFYLKLPRNKLLVYIYYRQFPNYSSNNKLPYLTKPNLPHTNALINGNISKYEQGGYK